MGAAGWRRACGRRVRGRTGSKGQVPERSPTPPLRPQAPPPVLRQRWPGVLVRPTCCSSQSDVLEGCRGARGKCGPGERYTRVRLCNADALGAEAEVCFHADVHTCLRCQPFSLFPSASAAYTPAGWVSVKRAQLGLSWPERWIISFFIACYFKVKLALFLRIGSCLMIHCHLNILCSRTLFRGKRLFCYKSPQALLPNDYGSQSFRLCERLWRNL